MAEVNSKYPFRMIKILAWIQVACGLLSVLWQVANISLKDLVGVAAAGLWCGVAYVIAGALGVAACRSTKACGLISWLAFSVMSMVFGLTLLAISIIGVILESLPPQTDMSESSTPYPNREVKASIDVILGICGLTATVVSIMAIVVSVKELCRRNKVPYQHMRNESSDFAVDELRTA